MELRYKRTDEDIRNILRASSRPLWVLLLFGLLLSGMFLVGIFLVEHDLASIGWIWLAVSAGLGVVVYVVPAVQIRWSIRRDPSLLTGEIVLLLNDEGIESTFPNGKVQLQWRAYTKCRETAHLFVLISPYRATYIPKRIMSPLQVEELRALLSARIPANTTTPPAT